MASHPKGSERVREILRESVAVKQALAEEGADARADLPRPRQQLARERELEHAVRPEDELQLALGALALRALALLTLALLARGLVLFALVLLAGLVGWHRVPPVSVRNVLEPTHDA